MNDLSARVKWLIVGGGGPLAMDQDLLMMMTEALPLQYSNYGAVAPLKANAWQDQS